MRTIKLHKPLRIVAIPRTNHPLGKKHKTKTGAKKEKRKEVV